MKYFIFTLGCQMNVSDSQRIASVLESCGLSPAKESEADLIVVNACSVRQKPVDRIWGKIRVWKNRPKPPKIMLTGCVLTADRKKLESKVDRIFNIKELPKLPQILQFHRIGYETNKDYFQIQPTISDMRLAYVPIMTGCDNFCSYCAVPYTRGREISRSEKEIVCEIRELVKRGTKSIVLLGQNVNSYCSKSQITNHKFQTNSK